MLGCTGEQTEGRWIALRNIFTKKLREAKTGQPSGSGSKKTKIWIYFKQMSFLIPHISHRMSRSSITASQEEKSLASQNITGSSILIEDSTVRTMSSPSNDVWNSMYLVTGSDDNISNPSLDEILSASTASSIASPIASDHQSVVTSNDLEDDVSECTNNRVQKEIAANVITKTKDNKVIQKKKVVPPLDQFAIKKQKRTETLENVLCQSSHALNVMASAYLHRSTDEEKPQQQQQQHPYITAIAEAMKQVPHEQQLTCFMSIMQVISTQCGKVMEK
ncbi:uncharacterized protein LOC113562586 [Ooceraea biroi]|uniref:uncharacterized protein LOC113562586 n=1 Tax=Ooceraea biroi TaxID=2015173 RepID=UPI000F07849D|nr:uncharacterized protein LOC113562586 [Ooceraea biroi]